MFSEAFDCSEALEMKRHCILEKAVKRFLIEMFSEAFACNEALKMKRQCGLERAVKRFFWFKCFQRLLIVMKRWR
jgi:hypothetical protein